MAQIPKGRKVICICESGTRSSMAARHLKAQGFRVSNMRDGMSLWVSAGLPEKTGLVKSGIAGKQNIRKILELFPHPCYDIHT
jgi:hypothetical protein